MRHPHADMIHEWAENPERVVELRWADGSWSPVNPMWHTTDTFRFADDPDRISPPPQVRTYQQRVEIPAALEELPGSGVVYAPSPDTDGGVMSAVARHSLRPKRWLQDGIAYATREDALARRDAMLMVEREVE